MATSLASPVANGAEERRKWRPAADHEASWEDATMLKDPAPREIFGVEDERIDRALDIEAFNRSSVYNHPGFAPVFAELTHASVAVTGEIPADLEGVYIRNGTNTQFPATKVRAHMFNGAGMLHQVTISGGKATYSNTYIRTPRFEFERFAGREVYVNFSDVAGGGQAGADKIALVARKKKLGLIPNLTEYEAVQSSTAIQYHHGKLYCLNEAGYPFVLDAKVVDGRLHLDGSGRFEKWNGKLASPFSAHPRIDPETGDMYNIAKDASNGGISLAHIHDGELESFATIVQQDAGQPFVAYVHDYFLTENYLVFPDISMRSSAERLLGPQGSVFFFDPNYKLRWGVVKRDFQPGDTVRWFQTDKPGSIWHMVNGWEEQRADGGTDIVLFAPRFHDYPSDMPIHTPAEPHAKFNKWVLNLETGQVTEDKQLLDGGHERPSLNLDYVGRKNRFAYLLDEARDGYMGKGVLKYDMLDEREVAYFDYGQAYGGEALFVPRAGANAEDEGYLLDLLMDGDKAFLVVIDARTMTEIARLDLPQRVPFGVHACWLNEAKLRSFA
jgi:carotenoid cleavage dioxygenase-like enzyme